MDTVETIVRDIVDRGVVSAGSFRGCTDDEIEVIRLDQRVSRLPMSYVWFLKTMGRSGGPIMVGTEAFFPGLLGLKEDARLLFEEDSAVVDLGPEAFIVAMHQGYQVFWFPSVEVLEPVVQMYQEGDVHHQPAREWPSFAAYLRDMISEID